MRTTITIRTDEPLRERLERRAAAAGVSLSALVREILENAVSEQPLGRRAGRLKGALEPPRDAGGADPWRDALRARNWRP